MTHNFGTDDLAQYAQDACTAMRKAGADAGDAIIFASEDINTACRLGDADYIERAEMQDIGLRAMIGKKQAFVAASGLGDGAQLASLAERVVAMAAAASEDRWCGLADADMLAHDFAGLDAELDLYDAHEPDADSLLAQALAAESIAREHEGITNSNGAGAHWSRSQIALATSAGFCGISRGTISTLSCSVIAGAGDSMETDYAAHITRHAAQQESPEAIGTRAAQRTIERLNPRKPKSAQLPVIFDRRVSATLLGHFTSAISGAAIARGTSFLKDKLNKQIMPQNITIIDDPHRKRGLASQAFDGEGAKCDPLTYLAQGTLQHWMLDSATARQLDLTSNGRARRGIGAPPVPAATNLHMENGTKSPAELARDIDSGVLITELIGMGVNMVTGDYSRGASGFYIENGEIAYPISEITIAGNLSDMFANLIAANDLEYRASTNAPSLLIPAMTIAGQ